MYKIQKRTTFGFSAENPTGTRNGGTRGKDCEKLRPRITIPAGETATLCDIDGEGMITHMWFTGYIGHGFIIRIYWENNDFPSVEAPISAFFGCGYDENFSDIDGKYPVLNSSMILVAPGRGYNSYFEMPFKKHCRITVENREATDKHLFYMISGWLGDVGENIGYFHAAYRQEHPVQKGRSYVVLDNIKGEGKFLGMTLSVGVNGHNTCWVEGEAKMYIDGEDYPSMNYTGTEDYFCGSYAFGNDVAMKKYQTFSAPYVGLYAILGDADAQYNAQKRFMLYRFHVKDEIYFEKSFTMKMDNLGWTGPRYDDYTTVAYYYLTEPAALTFELPENSELVMK
ncbi:MAG: DUF2961 domain-containing protein [Clostridia bacterium]|nr:DUF2961 domain-containing protein [Clostridia bacterium]